MRKLFGTRIDVGKLVMICK